MIYNGGKSREEANAGVYLKLKELEVNQWRNPRIWRSTRYTDPLDQINDRKRDRDRLIHALAKIPYDHESVKEIAVRGQALVRVRSSKVKSTNNHFDKLII